MANTTFSGPLNVNDVINSAGGVKLTGDSPIYDSSGNELVKFVKTASAVNEVTITNNSTGVGPSLSATGETNVPITLKGKGTGAVILGQATTTGVQLAADQAILDSSANELVKFSKTASAVNEFTVANAASGGSPVLSATGSGTNINVTLTAKGDGVVSATSAFTFPVGVATITNNSDQVYTAAQLLAGTIVRDPAGAGRADKASTAALIVAAIPGAYQGQGFEFTVVNSADGAEAITMTAADGVTYAGIAGQHNVINQNTSATFKARLANVGSGTEAVVMYRK